MNPWTILLIVSITILSYSCFALSGRWGKAEEAEHDKLRYLNDENLGGDWG